MEGPAPMLFEFFLTILDLRRTRKLPLQSSRVLDKKFRQYKEKNYSHLSNIDFLSTHYVRNTTITNQTF